MTLVIINFLAASAFFCLYKLNAERSKNNPNTNTRTPETGVKYNLPVIPNTGINEVKTVHIVYSKV